MTKPRSRKTAVFLLFSSKIGGQVCVEMNCKRSYFKNLVAFACPYRCEALSKTVRQVVRLPASSAILKTLLLLPDHTAAKPYQRPYGK